MSIRPADHFEIPDSNVKSDVEINRPSIPPSPTKRIRKSDVEVERPGDPSHETLLSEGMKSVPGNSVLEEPVPKETVPEEKAGTPHPTTTHTGGFSVESNSNSAMEVTEQAENDREEELFAFYSLTDVNVCPDKGNYNGDWTKLKIKISRFCAIRFANKPWDSLDDSTKERFTLWAPNARRLFETSFNPVSKYFFCSWIWRILDEHIFQSRKDELIDWTSPFYKMHNDMQTFLLNMADDMPQAECTAIWHHWKWSTTALLRSAMRAGRQHFPMARISENSVISILKQELGSHLHNLNKEQEECLLHLVKHTVNVEAFFSITMSDLRHFFHHPTTKEPHGFLFRKDLKMENVPHQTGLEDAESRRVELVVSPMLQCSGQSCLAYDKPGCREGMVVLFDCSDLLRASSDGAGMGDSSGVYKEGTEEDGEVRKDMGAH